MTKSKFIALAVIGTGLLVGSLASAQYYNPYTYQYPAQQTTYSYPSYPVQGACPNLYTNLTIGSRGQQVVELQSFLANRYGEYRLAGGYYGSLTSQYVARFQRENGLSATGGVGPQTRAAIARACGGMTPGYPIPTQPVPTSGGTFRLERNFDLRLGETRHEYRGELSITLNNIDGGNSYYWWRSNDPDEVRITLGVSCARGTYCLWYPKETFTLEEDESVEFMDYEVTLVELDRNEATFRVVDEDDDRDHDDDDAEITITDPTSGEEFDQGDEMRIAWRVTDEPNNASTILDLYTENDRFVGTIAIREGESDDFEWDIPEAGEYCTAQFPNGLCGRDLDGDYYIKARLVSGNGFENGFEYDEDDSAVFTIED